MLTGATGAIGGRILESLARARCGKIVAVFSREASYARFVAQQPLADNVVPLVADLRSDACIPLLSAMLVGRGPATFIHAAADVSWTKSLAAIEALNIGGALRVAKLAASHHPGQSRMVMFSTAYAHRQSGTLVNAYEQSKRLAEEAVLDSVGGRLKIGVIRPSLVVGATHTGCISRFNGLYPLVRVIALGELPCIVGDADYEIDLVPVDWVSDETLALANRLEGEPEPIFVTLAAEEQSIPLGRLVQLVQMHTAAWMAKAGMPAPQEVSIIRRRQFDFLMRAAPSWGLEERFIQINRIGDVMSGYLGHSSDNSPLRRGNVSRPPPSVDEYLPASIDFWLHKNRDRLLRERAASWAS